MSQASKRSKRAYPRWLSNLTHQAISCSFQGLVDLISKAPTMTILIWNDLVHHRVWHTLRWTQMCELKVLDVHQKLQKKTGKDCVLSHVAGWFQPQVVKAERDGSFKLLLLYCMSTYIYTVYHMFVHRICIHWSIASLFISKASPRGIWSTAPERPRYWTSLPSAAPEPTCQCATSLVVASLGKLQAKVMWPWWLLSLLEAFCFCNALKSHLLQRIRSFLDFDETSFLFVSAVAGKGAEKEGRVHGRDQQDFYLTTGNLSQPMLHSTSVSWNYTLPQNTASSHCMIAACVTNTKDAMILWLYDTSYSNGNRA